MPSTEEIDTISTAISIAIQIECAWQWHVAMALAFCEDPAKLAEALNAKA